MLALLLAGAVLATETQPLDGQALRRAMAEAATSPDTTALTGKRFRLVTPFVEEKARRYVAIKQSGRWMYDRRKGALITSVGFGEITDRNFQGFAQSGLAPLPPLQSFFFDVDVARGPTVDADGRQFFRMTPSDKPTPAGGQPSTNRITSFSLADSAKAVSFGLAIPYVENGASALPEGMRPLEVSHARGRRDHVERFARSLSLVVEGEITDLGQKPQVFCGGYRGSMTFKEITGDTPTWVTDQQCFVTARIDRVQVVRGEAVLSEWPKPSKAAD